SHAEAARTFRQLVDHRGTDPFSPLVPLAQLGLARALAASGDRAGAAQAYDVLLDWWAGADASLTLAAAARRERDALRASL
uniref:tetratricopeptide repeat protein n=1 Tax=Luteitalea sp. TaxID=2004800 RepID=UPI0025B8D972